MSPDKQNPDPDQFTLEGQTVGEEQEARQAEIAAQAEQIAQAAEGRQPDDKPVSEAAAEQGHDPEQTSMAEAAREKIRRILGK